MPKGLKDWLDLLASRPLPVLSSTKAELDELMSNTQLSVMQYAGPILFDPGLSTQLLKTTNRSRVAAGRQPLTTMTNVMSHLGQGMLRQQLEQARYLNDLNLPDVNRQGYLRYVAQACHASYQARDWAQLRGTHEPEEMQLAALLQNQAELALWCYGEDVMPQIEQRCYGLKQPYDDAAQAVLGCTTRQLSAALAEAWCMPEIGQDALRSDYRGFTLATGVALAARLARLSAMSWYDSQATQCIESIVTYKGRPQGEVESRLHQNALALSDRFVHLGYSAPARLLPMLVDENYIDPLYLAASGIQAAEQSAPPVAAKWPVEKAGAAKPVAASSTQPAKPLPPESVPAADKPAVASELTASIAAIHKMIADRVVVQQLVQQVVDSIRLLGFDRVMFALKAPKQQMLVGQFYAQAEKGKVLQNIKIPLDKPHLFSLLMEKNQHIWLQDKNRAKYWNLIPPATKLALDNDSFIAMSVFTGTRPLGLMYADKLKADISEDQYKKFQALCRLLSQGVVQILASKQADMKTASD